MNAQLAEKISRATDPFDRLAIISAEAKAFLAKVEEWLRDEWIDWDGISWD